MNHQDQLGWEKRWGVYAAIAAFGSALTGAAALAVGASLQSKSQINDVVEELISEHSHRGQYLSAIWLQGISIALLAGVLVYLHKATKYRRPAAQDALLYLTAVLPVVVGLLTVVSGIDHLHAADRVVPQLPLAPKQATDLANHETLHGTAATVGYVAAAVGLALAFAVGMVSMNARRAGLLSGFMGVLGVIVGVLLVLGGLLGMPPIVQYFWVTALGLLFLNRWPGQQGRGPAWDSGEEEPWPTAAELRAQAGGGGKSDGRARPPAGRPARRPVREEPVEEEDEEVYEADGDYDEEPEPEPAATQHPRSKKRKRKRRR